MFTPRLDLHRKRQTDVLFNAGGGGWIRANGASAGLKGGPAVASNPCSVDSGAVPGLSGVVPNACSTLGGEARAGRRHRPDIPQFQGRHACSGDHSFCHTQLHLANLLDQEARVKDEETSFDISQQSDKDSERTKEKEGTMAVEQVGEKYRCNVCGNEVTVTKVGGGTLVCCGEDMELLE